MKKNSFSKIAAVLALATLTVATSKAPAQDAAATAAAPATPPATAESAPAATTAPQLAYGASQILQLAQAKVGDDTIVAYIRNSGNSYALSAEQIIYLQQQGLSTSVLNAMLNQPKTAGLAYLPPVTTPAPAADAATDSQPADGSQPAASTVIVGPSVTAIDPSVAAAYAASYYPPYSYPYYYPAYGYYGFRPGVAVSIGWGGYGWRGGGFRGAGFRTVNIHGGFHR